MSGKQTEQQKLFQMNQPTVDPNKWWKGETPTLAETAGQVLLLTQQNPELGAQAQNYIYQLQSDPTSIFYNPFAQATNKSIATLQQLGFDVSNIDDNWIAQNSWLKEYYRDSNYTNNAAAPTKKSDAKEIAAYAYNQILKAKEDTDKAEQEIKALREEIGFYANSEKNYSDDWIVNQINQELETKYPTIAGMRASIAQGTPIELNRAMGDVADDDKLLVGLDNPGEELAKE
jgi:hypothetical protein